MADVYILGIYLFGFLATSIIGAWLDDGYDTPIVVLVAFFWPFAVAATIAASPTLATLWFKNYLQRSK